jgi:hypothetical protein
MSYQYSATQEPLGLSECQRLLGRPSSDVEELARRAGWHGLPGQQFQVSVETAFNMSVLSAAVSHGVEPQAMVIYLPALRSEGLLKLGERIANWRFHGEVGAEHKFWPTLYGDSETVRHRIASLINQSLSSLTRQIRFFSQMDVECLSPSQYNQNYSTRTPRFVIDSHDLAARLESVCGRPLFTARLAGPQ